MPAVLFGSISTLADTSERQRSAFNQAFKAHGLDWEWDREDYQQLLTGNGGKDRIATYAQERGQDVDAPAVHETKSQIFQESLRASPVAPRPGVVETVSSAHEAGWRVGLVTTTSPDNLTALLAGFEELSAADFDVVTDSGTVDAAKPDPDVYVAALEQLGEGADSCVAVEDNVGGVRAAFDAGLVVVAFPNENTAGHDFGGADVVDEVSFADLSYRVTT